MNSILKRILLFLGAIIVIVGVVLSEVGGTGTLLISYVVVTIGVALEIIEKVLELRYNRKEKLPTKNSIIFLIIYVVLLLIIWFVPNK